MRLALFASMAAVLILCGCGKENYREHETETFNREKTATFKKLKLVRSVLSSALWNEGDERSRPDECRSKLSRAVSAVSEISTLDSDFSFACKNLKCHGECRFHYLQSAMVSLAYMDCSRVRTSSPTIGFGDDAVTPRHRAAIKKAIASIDKATAALEDPERAVKSASADDE